MVQEARAYTNKSNSVIVQSQQYQRGKESQPNQLTDRKSDAVYLRAFINMSQLTYILRSRQYHSKHKVRCSEQGAADKPKSIKDVQHHKL